MSSRLRLLSRMAAARAAGRPHTLSHLVTGRCNGACPTCLWRDPSRGEMDTATIEWLYGEAGRAGVAQLVMWGGEPLLRPDLPQLLRAARRAGLVTTLITNGWAAEERWPELRGWIDVLIVSLDDVGPAHDRLRGLPGLFDRLASFAALLARDPSRPALLVNTVLSRLNPGALARVAPVARAWGAGLYFCPMETGEMQEAGFSARHASLALGARDIAAAAALACELKARGDPILNTRPYLDLLMRDPDVHGYVCRAPRAVLTVASDGAIRDCLRRDRPLATVPGLRDAGQPLRAVFAAPRWRAMAREAETCARCNNPDVVELSWLWDLRPAMVGKLLGLVRL